MFPVSGVVTIGYLLVADRYTYLPAIGLSLAVVWGLFELGQRMMTPRVLRSVASAADALILSVCFICSRAQLPYWRDTVRVMNRALEIDPDNFAAHFQLATFYLKRGDSTLGRYHQERADALTPEHSKPR